MKNSRTKDNPATLLRRYMQAWYTYCTNGNSVSNWRTNWLYKRCTMLGKRLLAVYFPKAKA